MLLCNPLKCCKWTKKWSLGFPNIWNSYKTISHPPQIEATMIDILLALICVHLVRKEREPLQEICQKIYTKEVQCWLTLFGMNANVTVKSWQWLNSRLNRAIKPFINGLAGWFRSIQAWHSLNSLGLVWQGSSRTEQLRAKLVKA